MPNGSVAASATELNVKFLRWVAAIVAVVAALAWAVAVGVGVYYSFKGGSEPTFLTSDAMKFLMPGLTALVGGVVAAAFGLANSKSTESNVRALGNVLGVQPANAEPETHAPRIFVAEAYVVVYLLFGAVAALTWIIAQGDTLEYVRTLASAWVGMFLGIAQGFFNY